MAIETAGLKTSDYIISGLLAGLSNIAQNKATAAQLSREREAKRKAAEWEIIKAYISKGGTPSQEIIQEIFPNALEETVNILTTPIPTSKEPKVNLKSPPETPQQPNLGFEVVSDPITGKLHTVLVDKNTGKPLENKFLTKEPTPKNEPTPKVPPKLPAKVHSQIEEKLSHLELYLERSLKDIKKLSDEEQDYARKLRNEFAKIPEKEIETIYVNYPNLQRKIRDAQQKIRAWRKKYNIPIIQVTPEGKKEKSKQQGKASSPSVTYNPYSELDVIPKKGK
ncbi:MAG: hypothetical protein AB1567_08440 [bacterium]